MPRMILCLVAILLAGSAGAAPGAVMSPAGQGEAPERYLVVPGDVLEITVSSHAGYDRTLTIQPDGRIQYPLIGELTAAGLTAKQLAGAIEKALRAQLIDPQVAVSLKELHRGMGSHVSVLGAVRSPGVFDLKEKRTVAELLAAAGGPEPLADLSRITITSADRSRVQTIDLSPVTETGKVDGDVPLQPGDLIIVPTGAPPTVVVAGEVSRPGSYAIQGQSRVLEVLSQAGGPTPRADLAKVRLIRAGQTQILDLQSLTGSAARGTSENNPRLRAGDMLVVAENERRVYVLGEVARPDGYALQEGERLLDLLTRAGGTTREANAAQAMLFRRDEHGQPVAQPLDLSRLLAKGDLSNNLPLQPRDVIFIPSARAKRPSAAAALLYPITSLLSLFW